MSDRTEIYPFQRVTENAGRKAKRQRRLARSYQALQGRLKGLQMKNVRGILTEYFNIVNIFMAAGAAIMSRAFLLGELLPFIYAFLAAFAYKKRSAGVVITAFSILGFLSVTNGFALWSNIIGMIILALAINNVKLAEHKAWWAIPALTAMVLMTAKSVLLLAYHPNLYQQMVIIFEAFISGILCFVFIIAGDVIKRHKAMVYFNFEEMAAFIVLGIGVVMGLNDLQVAGLGVSSILCRLGILIAAFLWGSGGGTMVGVMAGIIPSLTSSVFAQTLGMYAISGLLAGIFKNFGRLGVIIGYMLGTLALSMFVSETHLAVLGIWETGIASVIFLLLPESLKEKVPLESLGPLTRNKESMINNLDISIKETAQNRIHHLAQVFEELSSTFSQPGTPPTEKVNYLNYLYDELSHGFCEGCSRHNNCWNRDCYSTSQEILDILTIAEKAGQVNYEECPPAFKRKCLHGRELINAINYLFDNLRMNEYWSEKLGESRELVAVQLKGVSQVVKNLAEEIDIKTEVDYELRDKLLRSCKRIGVNLKEITPLYIAGQQLRLEVVAGSCVDGTGCDISIAPALSSIMGEKLEVTDKRCPRFMGKGACEFTLTRAFSYRVLSAAAQAARESVCGDSYTITTLKSGKELVVLSDGMGVGEKAWEESRTAVNLLQDLLNSGFDRELALRTINSVLLLRSSTETFTTLDIAMIDLYNGETDFIKTASAPSFIKQGRRVEVISASSLPIGIMNELDVVNEKRVLCPRDVIVMVSDGIMECSRLASGEKWISRMLADLNENDPQLIAEIILKHALSLAKGVPRDDMTVIALRLDLV